MEEEKKPDGRKNNGAVKGISRGQGRPRKTKNKDIDKMTLNALKKAFGSEEKAWIEIAKLAKDGSTQHMKWLLEYRYGRPKEQQKIEVDTKINIPVINFAKPEIIDITPENERIEPNRNEEQN
ncbi:MAG TPA: hypothetical protein DCW83_05515 [Saprospirales bacterium]|mgnify:FL=1|jgi:hypothetical protein|nr:hypothetical protein [Saprospirales bacterium]